MPGNPWSQTTFTWQGGECPVHPETYVGVIYSDGSWSTCKARKRNWEHSPDKLNIVAYCVIKEVNQP